MCRSTSESGTPVIERRKAVMHQPVRGYAFSRRAVLVAGVCVLGLIGCAEAKGPGSGTSAEGDQYQTQATTEEYDGFSVGPPAAGTTPGQSESEVRKLAYDLYGLPDDTTTVSAVFASYSDTEEDPDGQALHEASPVWLVKYDRLCGESKDGDCTYPYWTFVLDANTGDKIVAFSTGANQ
jgi:hypothetical protein